MLATKWGERSSLRAGLQRFLAIVTYEYNEKVREYYDQPSKIEMRYVAKSGRPVAFWHTPDFFVLYVDGAGWEEWKPEEKLIELAESMPNRYQRDEQGHWRCPPGEEYAERYGLTYKVRSTADLHPVYVRNLQFLEDYSRDPDLHVDDAALRRMRELFAEEPVITLKELLEHVEAQHIYSALLLRHLYVDLNAAPFADSEYVHIFRDEEVGRRLPHFDGVPLSASRFFFGRNEDRDRARSGVGWTCMDDL